MDKDTINSKMNMSLEDIIKKNKPERSDKPRRKDFSKNRGPPRKFNKPYRPARRV